MRSSPPLSIKDMSEKEYVKKYSFQIKKHRRGSANLAVKNKLAITFFVVAFSYAESQEEAPREAGRGLLILLFSNN